MKNDTQKTFGKNPNVFCVVIINPIFFVNFSDKILLYNLKVSFCYARLLKCPFHDRLTVLDHYYNRIDFELLLIFQDQIGIPAFFDAHFGIWCER